MSPILDREEYIEQAYFFRTVRERLEQSVPTQQVIAGIDQEILSTTRLPMAIQFLSTELKHTGILSSGFARLQHYFHPFQAFVIRQTESETRRFSIEMGLMILEREADYRAHEPTRPGLFVYQFEALSRNRLGYEEGLIAMEGDPLYDADWKTYLTFVRKQLGSIEFSDLVYLRSDWYVMDQRRKYPDYDPPLPPLMGEKEGKIAKASHGRDPLYLFAALQRQLGYPEVPRPKRRDDPEMKIEALRVKVKELETRLKLVEAEQRGKIDLSEFTNIPTVLPPVADIE